ncbi:MATE family efflux transporter [Acetobacter sicerae]|uniref:MATE family efflux transporter n=1 Tax=Acetobacter sicerae TaxID=85325 RepID=UPI00156ABF78|nr:MATE family efflux transporter [Acetobacter sicerae]NHN90551.1 MATE family efflux transporter [Acetobacter sicerae]
MPREALSIQKSESCDRSGPTDDTATRTLLKSFLIFMLPVLMDCVLQSIASTIGNVYIGRLLGAEDLAAASTFYPLLLILVSCGVGLGSGASVLVGQLWGAGHPERARAMASAAVAVSIVLGAVVAIAGQWAVWPMLRLFSVPANITDHAAQYCRVFLAGTPALILVVTVAITLRGAGDNIRPLVMMGLQIVVSLVVTPLLLTTSMGLSGAAVTAILGWVLALLLAGIWLRQSGHELAPGLGMLREMVPERQVLWSVIRLGFPAMVEVATQGLAEIVLVGRINGFGSEMTAAYGLFTQTLTYIEYPGMAVGITVSVMCAHAIGARNPQRARDVLRIGFLVGLIMTGTLAAIVTLIPETVSLLFTSNPHVIALASHAFRSVMWSAVLLSLGGVLGSAMRASGDSVAPMAIMLGCIAFVELPAGYLCAHYYGSWGVWFGYTTSFSAVFLASAAYWAVRWRHRSLLPVQ